MRGVVHILLGRQDRVWFDEDIPVEQLREGIAWMKNPEGVAPKSVQHLITALEMACDKAR